MIVDVGAHDFETIIAGSKDSTYIFETAAYFLYIPFLVLIVIVFLNFLISVSIEDVKVL